MNAIIGGYNGGYFAYQNNKGFSVALEYCRIQAASLRLVVGSHSAKLLEVKISSNIYNNQNTKNLCETSLLIGHFLTSMVNRNNCYDLLLKHCCYLVKVKRQTQRFVEQSDNIRNDPLFFIQQL